MNITIIGASAGVGLAAVKRALERGHTVTTLSRSEVAVPNNNRLHRVQGSALVEADLKRAITGSDAILVTLGTRGRIGATTIFSDFAQTLLKIHKAEPITVPVLILSGFGAGDSREYATPFARFGLRFVLNKVYEDKEKLEELIRSSTIKWEFVRPDVLTNRPLTEKYRVEPAYYNGMKSGWISRNDVADFMVKQAESPTYVGKSPGLFGK